MKAEKLLITKDSSSNIESPLLLSPEIYQDSRGFFFESWNQAKWTKIFLNYGYEVPKFVQDNHSCSLQGVLRGLHYQRSPNAQGKLIRCVVGEIFDVAVDLRQKSPHFGEWVGVFLNSENHKQLWVPNGFAHGFLTISKIAEVLYKTTSFWNPQYEQSIHWNDKDISIKWPLQKIHNNQPSLSSKDNGALNLSQIPEDYLF